MVLLQHDLPDGSSHFDWLIEPTAGLPPAPAGQARDPNERCLLSFRVLDRIDRPNVELFPADRLHDHRRHYLTFEGVLPPKAGQPRGSVRRVARGYVHDLAITTDRIVVIAQFMARERFTWTGTLAADLWTFTRSER